MSPQAIVDLLLSLLPVVASIAPSVYAALFGAATVESMATRAREALAKAGGTRAAMEALFEPHPAVVAVVQKSPQVSAHMSDRLRKLSLSTSLTAEDRDVLEKSATLIASAVAHSETLAPLMRDLGVRDAGIPAKFLREMGTADTVPAPSASVPEMQQRLASLKREAAGNADAVRVEYLRAEIDVIESALKRAGAWGEPGEGD